MSVTIQLHPYLTQFAGGNDTVFATGNTVSECIENLERRYPSVSRGLCDEKDVFHDYWEIYINSASAFPDEMPKPVKDGDEITLVIFVDGG